MELKNPIIEWKGWKWAGVWPWFGITPWFIYVGPYFIRRKKARGWD